MVWSASKALLLSLVLLLTQEVSWAGYGDFLIQNDIVVDHSAYDGVRHSVHNSLGKISAHSSLGNLSAHDSLGNRYRMRLNTGVDGYAEIGSSILIDQVGLPNLPVYPILFDQGRNGLVQPASSLHAFNAKDLTGRQLAELVGHFLASFIVGNPHSSLWNGKEGSIGFDGKHFYTLDASQNFKFFPESQKASVSEVLRNLLSQSPDLFKNLDPQKAKKFSKELNIILTRMEKLGKQQVNPALQSYFKAANDRRQKAGEPPYDFESQLKARIHALRLEVASVLPDLSSIKEPDSSVSSESSLPSLDDTPAVEHPQLSFTDTGPVPSAKGQSSEELLWGYYFQNSEERRQAAETQWAKELELSRNEVIPALINLVPSRRLAKAEFQLEDEFPNYYMKSSHSSEEIQQVLALAMKSLLSRLEVPFEKEGQIYRRGFFQYLVDSAESIDRGAQVYISGGVVRSMLGYLYQVVYNKMQKNSKQDAWDILNEFSKNTTAIDPTRVLGVGSDFDVLVTPSQEKLGQRLVLFLKDRINSARRHLKLEDDKDPVVSTLVPYGDANIYSNQIRRSIESGGNTIDYLAYHLGKFEFKEPDELPGTLKDYIHGEMDYLPAKSDVTTIRGIRSLLELLYVRYRKAGEKELIHELNDLTQKKSQGKALSSLAMVQFEKATRNARKWGAHNRLFESHEPLEENIRKLIYAIGGDHIKKLLVIPKFTPKIKAAQKTKRTLPDSLFMDLNVFKRDYTENGVLFHGTPQCEYILAMIRNGFVRSGDEGGRANFGPGTYTTNNYSTASEYIGINGCIVPLPLRENPKPKILKWSMVEKNPLIQQIVRDARALGVHEFIYLAQVYGVDIIVNDHVIVENTAVLEIPKNLRGVIKNQFEVILSRHFQKKEEDPTQFEFDGEFERRRGRSSRFNGIAFKNDLDQYIALYQLVRAANLEGTHSPLSLIGRAVERLDRTSGKRYREAVESGDPKAIQDVLLDLLDPDANINYDALYKFILPYLSLHPMTSAVQLLRKAIQHSTPTSGEIIVNQAGSFSYPENIHLLEEALQAPYEQIQRIALDQMTQYQGADLLRLIKKALVQSNPEIRLRGAEVLKYYSGEEKVPLLRILFRDPVVAVRSMALSIILNSDDLMDPASLLEEFFKAQEPISLEEMNRDYRTTLSDSMLNLGKSLDKFYACLTHRNPKIAAFFTTNLHLFPWVKHPHAKPLLEKVYALYKSNPTSFDLVPQLYNDTRTATNFPLPFEVLDRSDQIDLLLHQSLATPISKTTADSTRLGIPSYKWGYGLTLIENQVIPPLSVGEHEREVKEYFAELGLNPETWIRRKYLLKNGRLRASDAYEPGYFDQTAALLAEEVKREIQSSDRKIKSSFWTKFKNAVPYKSQILNTPEFKKITSEWREKMNEDHSSSSNYYSSLLALGDPSEATQQNFIEHYRRYDYMNSGPQLQLCEYLKATGSHMFHAVVKEMDARFWRAIGYTIHDTIGRTADTLWQLDRSPCGSDFQQTRQRIREFMIEWCKDPRRSNFLEGWIGFAIPLFESSHPELWKEEIGILQNALHAYLGIHPVSFEQWKELLPVISLLEGHEEWKQRQAALMRPAIIRYLNSSKIGSKGLDVETFVDFKTSPSLWKEERHAVAQHLYHKLNEGQLDYSNAVYFGRLLEYDAEEKETQVIYESLRSKAQEFLSEKDLTLTNWIHVSFFSLLSPLAQSWKEVHEQLRARLREILQSYEKSGKKIYEGDLDYLAELLLMSKPADSWSEERKLIRDLILKKMKDGLVSSTTLTFLLQLYNREPGDLDWNIFLNEVGENYKNDSSFLPHFNEEVEWSDFMFHGLGLTSRPDFQDLQETLTSLISSNNSRKIDQVITCINKDDRAEAFRSEAHQWLLKASPSQLKQFVFHNKLRRPENAYLVEAAKIEDTQARKKFLGEKAGCFENRNLPKLLEQLKSVQNPPLLGCPK